MADALNDQGKSLRGSKVLAVGVGYKEGVEDTRGSPALAVMQRIVAKGAVLSYHDPFVASVEIGDRSLKSVELSPNVIAEQDCIVVLTAHSGVDYGSLIRKASLLFDTRGISVGNDAPNVVRL
jgi:UDP-N-acetyl-D-glucosamine dehydrogenase